MEEFKIQKGEPLSPETIIDLPERSYAQEVLLTPIPFSNRVDVLSDYFKPSSRSLTAKEIAVFLNTSEWNVVKLADKLQASIVPYSTEEEPRYEMYTLEVIQEELEWQKTVKELPEFLSAKKIGSYLNKEYDWVIRNAYEIAAYSEINDSRYKNQAVVYHKDTIEMLRELILHAPPANDWYLQSELEDILGKSTSWIKKRVKDYEIQSSPRTALISGEVVPHYPPEALALLTDLLEEIPPPALDWMTEQGMARELGVDPGWIRARIVPYRNLAEQRLNIGNIPHLHFPPSVFDELTCLLNEVPTAEAGWLTAGEIEKLLSLSDTWVSKRLEPYKDQAVSLRSSVNRPLYHYPPEVVELLRDEAEKLAPPAQDWITKKKMSKILGKHGSWIDLRLSKVHARPEMRRDSLGREFIHYSPFVYQRLHDLMVEERTDKR